MLSLILTSAVACAQPAAAQQPPLPTVEFTVEVLGNRLADFTTKMDAYAELRRSLEQGLPPLSVTDHPAEIRRAERLLAERIRKARAGARRHDIFTEDIRRGFRQVLRRVINRGICAAIADDNPREFRYPVNGEYPKDRPVSTVPASILNALPALPPDVHYRFLDLDLILHDTRANIILDRIDVAIDCP